jgi:hypothetical protein
MKSEILIAGIQSVTKEWTKQRKAEERQASGFCCKNSTWHGRGVIGALD